MSYIVAAAFVVLLAIFFQSDASFPLYFLKLPQSGNSFENQVIWVTGASSGIGASLAKDLTRQGAQVIISARRIDQLNLVATNCSGKYVPLVLQLDVTDFEAQKSAVEFIFEKYGRIDSVVLNAGRSQRALAVDFPFSSTKELMELNFFSVIHLTKLILPNMIKDRRGQIVVVSSVTGRIGTPISSSYSASKFALHGYFEALRHEIHPYNISVSLVCPGPVATEITENMLRSPSDKSKSEEAASSKMTVERCTELMLIGMYHRVEEMWISVHPVLLFTFLSTYAPYLSRQLAKYIIAPSRIKAFLTGGDVYSTSVLFGLGTENNKKKQKTIQ